MLRVAKLFNNFRGFCNDECKIGICRTRPRRALWRNADALKRTKKIKVGLSNNIFHFHFPISISTNCNEREEIGSTGFLAHFKFFEVLLLVQFLYCCFIFKVLNRWWRWWQMQQKIKLYLWWWARFCKSWFLKMGHSSCHFVNLSLSKHQNIFYNT